MTGTLQNEGGSHQGGAWNGVPYVAQCHGTNVGPMGTLRQGNGGVTGGVPFLVAGHCTGPGWWNEAEIAGTLRAEGENRPSRPSNIVAYGVSENQRAEVLLADYSHQLTSGGGKPGQGYPFVAFDWQAGHGNDTSFRGKSRSYIVRKGDYAQIRKNAHDAIHGPFGVRRLTPTECERLQGLPDGHTEGQSDTQRYKQLGNAACEKEAKWLGRRILEAAS